MRKDVFFHLMAPVGMNLFLSQPWYGSPSSPWLQINTATGLKAAHRALKAEPSRRVHYHCGGIIQHFFYLLTNPVIFTRLRQDLEENIPRDVEVVSSSALSKLPFLNAVINETLQLQPPVPNGVQHIPPPSSGFVTIGDIIVPPDTTVQVPFYGSM